MRGRLIFSVGASTSAVPPITFCPSWLVHTQSKRMWWLWSNLRVAVSVTVMVSPRPTGREKCSVWSM